ncbi:hypothetical protein [Achromobacter xylosoxidans]|uniref:hypothetical protein n=1 Tax=Alcaligenes xylosoxydans xylosoxydans TaxID=85698 RepID=UPI001F138A0B|nr:hypothetical protein [Achromobacter xylosoxidans]MDH0523459.1 hypothetical protein [Achromobacter xylosoxidans]MDH0542460.1 hypothetical protein [Achromobacter xylosoxidans]
MDQPPSSLFVRILITIFCLFLGVMVVFRFFFLEPRGEISSGLLVLLSLVLVLVLSELFDNFSIGKLVNMSKSLKEKEAQKTELKKENAELRTQLISVTTSVSQRQTSTNIFGIPDQMADLLTVKKAADEEVAAKRREEEVPRGTVTETPIRRIDRMKLESTSIAKFVSTQNLQSFNIIHEAKLSTQFSGIDPITDTTPIFDAYINTADSEVFVETRPISSASLIFRDRLYVMLTKLHHYKTIKKANVYLALVLANVQEDASRITGLYLDRLHREFEPAITSGLLRIHVLEFTSEEIAAFYTDSPGI